jgi:hypothetical protein
MIQGINMFYWLLAEFIKKLEFANFAARKLIGGAQAAMRPLR